MVQALVSLEKMMQPSSVASPSAEPFACRGSFHPNPARSVVAENSFGSWTDLGNPCADTDACKTFHLQSTFVVPVLGRDLVSLFKADRSNRWNLPDSRGVWLPFELSVAATPLLPGPERWPLNASSKSKLLASKKPLEEQLIFIWTT